MADARSIEPPTMQGSTPTAVIGATSTSARGIEIDQYGVKRRQGALGIGDLEADAGAQWWSSRGRIMAGPGSAAGA